MGSLIPQTILVGAAHARNRTPHRNWSTAACERVRRSRSLSVERLVAAIGSARRVELLFAAPRSHRSKAQGRVDVGHGPARTGCGIVGEGSGDARCVDRTREEILPRWQQRRERLSYGGIEPARRSHPPWCRRTRESHSRLTDPALDRLDRAKSTWLRSEQLENVMPDCTLLCRTAYGNPYSVEVRGDGRLVGKAGYAHEDCDEGSWWIEDDHWCRR